MQNKLYSSLPPPTHGKNGWPWTNESTQYAVQRETKVWPTISIVIPGFNQAAYLEQAIRSVLFQGYPKCELIVIDGGSTDGSVEIIKRYASFLAYWTSEKDRGQAHAINKGMKRATGSILAYLNSDDLYLPDALYTVAEYAMRNPDIDLIYGGCRVIDKVGNKTGERRGNISTLGEMINLWDVWWKQGNFVQPEVFWTRRIAEKAGPFREDLYYVMDYDYWLRIFLAGGRTGKIDKELASFRITPEQKSRQSAKVALELLQVIEPVLWNDRLPISVWQRYQLRSRWLYQRYFLPEVEKSLDKGEKTLTRWFRLLCVIARHPGMLMFGGLHSRMFSGLHRLKPGP